MAQQDKPIVFDTPEGISYAQLAAVKGALKLEKVGLKTRGGPIRPAWAEKLGLKPRDSHDKFIAEIQKRMDAILASNEEKARGG